VKAGCNEPSIFKEKMIRSRRHKDIRAKNQRGVVRTNGSFGRQGGEGELSFPSGGEQDSVEDAPDRVGLLIRPSEASSRSGHFSKSQSGDAIIELGYPSPVNDVIVLVRRTADQVKVSRHHHWVSGRGNLPLNFLKESFGVGVVSRTVDSNKFKQEGRGFVEKGSTEKEFTLVQLTHLQNLVSDAKK
jgi:hypothetical protein